MRALPLIIALALPGSAFALRSDPALDLDAASGVRAVDSVVPQMLQAAPTGSARQCVRVVEVVDATQACHAMTCQQIFSSRRNRVLREEQRALLAGPCSSAADAPGRVLLWGSTSLLVLQPARNGTDLWSQRKESGRWVIDIETEGSHGTLSYGPRGFKWQEHPN